MNPDIPRKGARRMADIPPDILQAINQGKLPTANLTEFLAADLAQLLPAVAGQIGLDPQHPALRAAVDHLPRLKPMQRHGHIAGALLQAGAHDPPIHSRLSRHISDLARQWAALQIGLQADLDLTRQLDKIRPFAADPHFGVREIAWMAVRPAVARELDTALDLLQAWVHTEDANLRRFASELTRPRGVWCPHLETLKNTPALGLPLLTPLQADPSRYVQDSVANWLNDAAKTQPDWVRKICADWLEGNQGKATAYICKRALRSLPAG